MADPKFETLKNLIEEAIRQLGVNPKDARGEYDGQWDLKRGSATVWIDIVKDSEGNLYFQVMSPMFNVPQNPEERLKFYEELLEKNFKMVNVSLCKNDKSYYIYLKTVREAENLQLEEIIAQIRRVGFYSDELDDYFINKYNLRGYSE